MRSIYDLALNFIKSLESYQKEGFLFTGMYPFSRDENTLTIVEFDSVMVRLSN